MRNLLEVLSPLPARERMKVKVLVQRAFPRANQDSVPFFCVILSAAKNSGSFSAQTTAPSTMDRPPQTPVAPRLSASANPGFFASL